MLAGLGKSMQANKSQRNSTKVTTSQHKSTLEWYFIAVAWDGRSESPDDWPLVGVESGTLLYKYVSVDVGMKSSCDNYEVVKWEIWSPSKSSEAMNMKSPKKKTKTRSSSHSYEVLKSWGNKYEVQRQKI